jgi:aspartate aminotransferase
MNSDQACDYLLEKAKIVTVPGSAFGKAGEGYVRISFGTSEKNLKKAIKNLENL